MFESLLIDFVVNRQLQQRQSAINVNLVPRWLEFQQRQSSPTHTLICGSPSSDVAWVSGNAAIDAFDDEAGFVVPSSVENAASSSLPDSVCLALIGALCKW